MTDPRQPWSRGDASASPDRAFLEDLFLRWQKEESEREQRLLKRLDWLVVRWMLISAAIGVVISLLYFVWFFIGAR